MKYNRLHPWDLACQLIVERASPAMGNGERIFPLAPLDSGIQFFVLALEEMGATTHYSCEGHPKNSYVSFDAPDEIARLLQDTGAWSFTWHGRSGYHNDFCINTLRYERLNESVFGKYTEAHRVTFLRNAAQAWLECFGDRLPKLKQMLNDLSMELARAPTTKPFDRRR